MTMLRRLELEERNGRSYGSTNSTTPVTVVAAPSTGFVRKVRAIRFVNKDTANVTIRVRLVSGGDTTEFDNSVDLIPNGKFLPVEGADVMHLTSSDSITAILDAAVATTQPSWVAAWTDVYVAT